MYQPAPIPTTGLTLPPDLQALAETLCRHVHDLWVLERMSRGWQHAPTYDEARRLDPRLIPFDQLSPADQNVTRGKTHQTLTALLALGVRLEPGATAADASASAAAAGVELERVLSGHDLAALRAAWDSLTDAQRSESLCARIGQRILRIGEPLIAFDILSDGIQLWPSSVRLRQLTALALSRSGATMQANQILSNLFREGHTDGETLGLLARTHKDLADIADRPNKQTLHLELAGRFYEQGYRFALDAGRMDDAYYTGINAATVALLRGDAEHARSIARRVREICLQRLAEMNQTAGEHDTYWLHATLGEAALVLGEWTEAHDHYAAASRVGAGEYASLNSTRKQAARLLRHVGRDESAVARMFEIPPVAVFSGHMIDQPDRPTPRFRPESEPAVAAAIADELDRTGAAFGYASAACGGDLLFLEAMLKRGGEAHVILPCPPPEFRLASVDIIPRSHWGARFERVLSRATSVVETGGPGSLNTPWAFEYTNRVTLGLALLRAETLGTHVRTLAVWDGGAGDGIGGADSSIRYWRSVGLEPAVIRPDGAPVTPPSPIHAAASAAPSPASVECRSKRRLGSAELVVMLFGDAVRFSKLTESQLPLFIDHYLGLVADVASAHQAKPITSNTWGDGLFMVFDRVRDAGLFALELARRISTRDWTAVGLPHDLNIRIALHVGPAIAVHDPLTQRLNFLGSHVSRTARIEPITPPGRVYASQPFASLAAAERIRQFSCEYVGRTPLAKGYGTFPTYHVRPARIEPHRPIADYDG